MARLTFVIVAAMFLASKAAGDGHSQSCLENQEECKQKLRKLMTDEDRFWFGNVFSTNCKDDSQNIACINLDSTSKSILTRFYSTSKPNEEIKTIADGLELAMVSFSAPEQKVVACGNEFHLPELNDLILDPRAVTRVTQASLGFTPEVKWWNYENGQKSTVIIWDAGSGFLHGLYVNVQNGDMSTGKAIWPYRGPNNSAPRAQPYLFLVMPQNRSIDDNTVTSAAEVARGKTIAADSFFGRFRPQTFLELLSGILEDPVAANVLITVGDACAAERAKDYSGFNACPYFVSQQEYLRKALTSTKVSSDFDSDAVSIPYLPTLAYDMEIVFNTEDIEFESCCSEFSYPKSMLIPNPFSSVPERPVKVRSTPRVEFKPMNSRGVMDGKNFTLMLVDFESIDMPPTADMGARLHWLVTNIPNGKVVAGETVIPHFGATPFSKGSPRMYAFLLFEQKMYLKWKNSVKDYRTDMNCMDYTSDRCKYYLNAMIKDWQLGQVKGVTWYLAEQDAFARQRIYREWKAMSKYDVCKKEQPGVLVNGDCPRDDVRDGATATSSIVMFVSLMAAISTVLTRNT